MQGNNCPKAKLPFDVNWFNIIPQYFNLNQMDDRIFFFYMTLSFSGFLRISELLNLQKKDLELSNDNQILTLYIKIRKPINLVVDAGPLFTIMKPHGHQSAF